MQRTLNLRICLDREHLRRTGLICIVVGTWLTLFNQIGPLLAWNLDLALFIKVVLNYVTPFVVANAGLLSRQDD